MQFSTKHIESATSNTLSFKELEEILLFFSTSLLTKKTEEELLWDVVRNCISKLGFIDCVIYLIDRDKNALVQRAAHGPKNPKLERIIEPLDIPIGFGISGFVAQTGIAEIIHDTTLDPRYIVDDSRRLSEICIPIIHEGQVLGVIDCEHHERHFFHEQHLRVLQAIAAICGVKLISIRQEIEATQRQKQLIETEQKLARLRIKAFQSQMNPHFVFNALNSIQYFITTNSKKTALSYLSNFGKLIRYNLRLLGKESVDIHEEINMLTIYLNIQKLRYNDQFNYTINVNPSQVEAHIPTLLIHTLFENIIELGVKENKLKYDLFIDIELDHEQVLVKVLIEHDPKKFNSTYLPEYRKNILDWEKQVSAYVKYKGYNISKSIDLQYDNQQNIIGNKIRLNLPNII